MHTVCIHEYKNTQSPYSTCLHACIYTYKHAYMHAGRHAYTYIHMFMHVYTYIQTYILYMHVYACIYVHTKIQYTFILWKHAYSHSSTYAHMNISKTSQLFKTHLNTHIHTDFTYINTVSLPCTLYTLLSPRWSWLWGRKNQPCGLCDTCS